MRIVLRLALAGSALALVALPLASTASNVAGASTTTAQVTATNWSLMPNTQSVSASTEAFASSVSCVTSTYCMAVGSGFLFGGAYYAELWNGSTWSPVTLPSTGGADTFPRTGVVRVHVVLRRRGHHRPRQQRRRDVDRAVERDGLDHRARDADSSTTLLGGVACTSATFCLAVGLTATSSTSDQLLSELGTVRHGRSPACLPLRAARSWSLSASHADRPRSCMAVGLSGPEMGGGGAAQAWSGYWNGTSLDDPSGPLHQRRHHVPGGRVLRRHELLHGRGLLRAHRLDRRRTNVVDTWNGSTWSQGPTPAATAPGNILAA